MASLLTLKANAFNPSALHASNVLPPFMIDTSEAFDRIGKIHLVMYLP